MASINPYWQSKLPIRIFAGDFDYYKERGIEKWCDAELGDGNWSASYNGVGYVFYVGTEDHAILFKLRWC